MKLFQSNAKLSATQPDASSKLGRRGLVMGAGAAGAAAVAAAAFRPGALPKAEVAAGQAAPASAADGYQVTQHVLRYYETAKV
jgi:hypothetical protein